MSGNEQIEKFLTNTLYFLEEILESVILVHKQYPSLKITITPDLINSKINEVKAIQSIGGGSFVIDIFIKNCYLYWNRVKNRDLNFLQTQLETIIPATFMKDIQFLLGNNTERKIYASEDTIDQLWDFLTAMIYNSVRYVKYEKLTDLPNDFIHYAKEWSV